MDADEAQDTQPESEPQPEPERTITTLDEALAALTETRAESMKRRQQLSELGPLTKLQGDQARIIRDLAESVVSGDSETTFTILVEQAQAMAGDNWRDIISSTFPVDNEGEQPMAEESQSDQVTLSRQELQEMVTAAAQELIESRFAERDQRTEQQRLVDTALDAARELGYKRDAENPVTRALLWAALSREGSADMPIAERVKAAHDSFQAELAGFQGAQRDAGLGAQRDAGSSRMPPPPPSSGAGASVPNPDGEKLTPREKAMARLEAMGADFV